MRHARTRLAVPLILLVLAGCGGEQVVVNNVPGGPVDLKVPGNGDGLSGRATPTPTAEASETPTGDAEATPTAAAGGATEAPTDTGAQTDPNTGGAAEAPPTDNGTGTQAPDPGAPKEEFEDYCAQNPGAC